MGIFMLAACSPDGGGSSGVCGNGVVEHGEECDGTDLAGATCGSLGFTGGVLTCSEQCQLNTSMCMSDGSGTNSSTNSGNSSTGAVCGNGVVEQGEECDGTVFGGATCESLGFAGGGHLDCTAQCTVDTSGCFGTTCGNGHLDSGEECDGTSLGGESCESLGYIGGILRCRDSCTFDESSCTNDAVQAVCERWNSDVATAQSGQWTGDVNSCDAGDYLAPGRDSALKLTNLYRWLAALSPV